MQKPSLQKTSSVGPLRFFLLTFLLSWIIWIPLTLAHFGIGPFKIAEDLSSIIRLLGVMMPMISALLLTSIYGGRPAVRVVLSRLKIWRVGKKWWVAVLLVYPSLLILAGIVYNLFHMQPALALLQVTAGTLFANILFLAIASLGEEIGWRGVALPSLLERYQPLPASLILGIIWATWHLPFWILLDTLSQYGAGYFILNYIFIISATFYITWIFIHSKGSILLPVVFHLVFNSVNVAVFPVTSTTPSFAVFVGLQLLVVVIAIMKLRKNQMQQLNTPIDNHG
jgi:membrane protease YdiL (CAAX protease family)